MRYRLPGLLLLTLYLLAATTQALAAPTLQLSHAQNSYALGPWLDILEDPSGELSIDDISSAKYATRFKASTQAIPNFGFSNSAFWVRLRLRNNTSDTPVWLLEQHYANTHYLDLYRPSPVSAGFIKHSSGNLRPLENRDVEHQRIVFKFPLPMGEEQTLYLRLKNGSSSTLDLKLWQPEAFATSDRLETAWLGLLAGSLLFFLCYSLLAWLTQRDSNYLWQALFITSILITLAFYEGFAQLLIGPAAVRWSHYATPIFLPLSLIAILGFIHTFLPPKDPDSWRNRLHKWHMIFWLGLLPLLIAVAPYTLMVNIIAPLSMAYIVYILAWAILAWREKQPAAQLFLSGWSVFLLAILMVLAVRTGWLAPNFISENEPVGISLIWLALFSALAQASRVHHLRRQSEQAGAALCESENQRRLAMQIGRIGTWSYDPVSHRIDCSPEALALMTGRPATHHSVSDCSELHKRIHADDWENLATRTRVALDDGSPLSTEFRTNHPHELPRWLEIYGEVRDDFRGKTQSDARSKKGLSTRILHGTLQDITERKQRETEAQQSGDTLRGIASAISSATGEAFFRELVQSSAHLFNIDHVIIGLRDESDERRVRSIALCSHGVISDNIRYTHANGPCGIFIKGKSYACCDDMRTQFPNSEMLALLNTNSCVGAPLLDSDGTPLGFIAALNTHALSNCTRIQSILSIFAVRASAELQRLKAEQQLQTAQQRLAQHIRDTPLAVIEWNPQMEVTAWNPAAEAIFGFSADEALGKHATELILNAEIRPHIQPAWDALMAQQGGTHNINDNLTKDRGTITCNWFNTPLINSTGEVTGIASMVSDISEQVTAQKELTQHRDHLEDLVSQRSAEIQEQARIIDQVQDSVVAIDMQGKITYWNHGASAHIGYSEEEALGQFIGFIHAEADPVDLSKTLEQLGTHDTLERELPICRKDGTQFKAHLSLSLRRDDNGQPSGMVGIILDISERKQAEEELEKQRLALKNTNSELEAFSYSVSHDLRAPLRALNGFSLALLEDYGEQLDDTAADYIQRLRAATLRMSDRIDSLLTLSRLTSSHMQRKIIDLSGMANEVIQQLQEHEPERQVVWEIKSGISALADEALFRAVLDNLLGNAWKYTAKTADAKISFETRQTEKGKTYVVSDNGAGFDMQHADKLFAPFRRLHNETDFPGSGVGLATVARIIHRHGGEVWAEADVGKGASLYFTLP